MLLLCSPNNLQLRWQQLQQLLAVVPEQKLGHQLRRTPELLLMRPSTLAAKLKCLELLFAPANKQHGTAAAGAAGGVGDVAGQAEQGGQQQQEEQQQQPQRLLQVYKHHQLSYRLQRLQQLAQHHGMSPAWKSPYGYGHTNGSNNTMANPVAAAVRKQTAAGAAAAAAGSAAAATDPGVQHLVLKVPGLLSLNPSTLHSHIVELQLLLALQPDDPRLTRLVLLQPGLLTQAPRTLANKLQLLQHLTGRSEAYVLEMVLRCPAVLTLSAESVSRKWGVLRECVGACGVWRQQLATAPAVSVAMMLCYSLQRLQRLQYVVQLSHRQQQQQQQQSLAKPKTADLDDVVGASGGASSSSSSTATGRGSSRGRAQRRANSCVHADAVCSSRSSDDSSTTSSSRRLQGRAAASQAEQQVSDLAAVPWKSMIQESDAVFCTRFPGYTAWQQQQ
jgi:hypothetical protein